MDKKMTYPKASKHKKLTPEELRWKCNPDIFKFDSTEDLKPIEYLAKNEH